MTDKINQLEPYQRHIAAVMAQQSKARAYIERVIIEDFGAPLDELMALLFVGTGPLPAPKPYSGMSEWKDRAHRILLDYVTGRPGYRCAREYALLVVLYLCRRAGKVVATSDYVRPAWESSYAHQIRAARAKARSNKSDPRGNRRPVRDDESDF